MFKTYQDKNVLDMAKEILEANKKPGPPYEYVQAYSAYSPDVAKALLDINERLNVLMKTLKDQE